MGNREGGRGLTDGGAGGGPRSGGGNNPGYGGSGGDVPGSGGSGICSVTIHTTNHAIHKKMGWGFALTK